MAVAAELADAAFAVPAAAGCVAATDMSGPRAEMMPMAIAFSSCPVAAETRPQIYNNLPPTFSLFFVATVTISGVHSGGDGHRTAWSRAGLAVNWASLGGYLVRGLLW